MAKYTYHNNIKKWRNNIKGEWIEPIEFYKNGKAKPPKKKMTTQKKGQLSEQKTQKYLENLGCIVHTIKSVKSSHGGKFFAINADIFGLFDHVAFLDIEKKNKVGDILVTDIFPFPLKDNYKIDYNNYATVDLLKGETFYIQTKTNQVNRETRELISKIPIKQHKLIFVWKDGVEEPKIILC